MLKATAVTTAGAALFAGSAQATETSQINWCGCSQVCVESVDDGGVPGTYLVLRAVETEMDDDAENGIWMGWKFDTLAVEEMPFCSVQPDEETKLIAITTQGEVRGGQDDDGEYHCNPGQCASKALTAYEDFATTDDLDRAIVPIDDPDDEISFDQFNAQTGGYTCITSEFGPGQEDFDGTDRIDIVRGRCGEPGKDDESRGNGNGNGNGNGK
jgi:hypothetical protein